MMRALAFAICLGALAPAGAHTGIAPVREAAAAFELGRQYRNGIGVERDGARAIAYLETAARLRHPAAMFTLSNMLGAGEGAPRNERAARQWLEAAAQLEYPEALQQMALHVQHGSLGYARDEQRAAQLMRVTAHAMKHRVPQH